MKKKIPYGKQNITETDINAVIKALNSDLITQGPYVPKFESKISALTGSKYVSAVNSATSALHLGCKALGVNSDSLVWTSTNSFVASANAAVYCGAKIDFIDIDVSTFNISIPQLKYKLTVAKKNNNLPDLIIPVHLAGSSCDMKEIYRLSKKFKFKILEDASHCIGGDYMNKKIGSCQYSHACVFSFHPVKIITTGEGGAITTNDKILDYKIKNLRSHGIERNTKKFLSADSLDWYYEQQDLGFNYRITDIQAALGLSQLKRIKSNIKKRNKIARYYDKNLNIKGVVKPDLSLFKGSSFHLYIIRVKKFRDRLRNHLLSKNIMCNLHYFPIHLQPFYKALGFKKTMYPNAEEYAEDALSIPIYPELAKDEMDKIIFEIESFFANVS